MGRRKNDTVMEGFYMPFYQRGKQARNPDQNRTAIYERMYERILGELCMNRFEWKGFPESVDVRWLELNEYQNALAVAFVDRDTDRLMVLRGTASGQKNLVDHHISFTVSGPNFAGRQIAARECVPIWANYFRTPDWDVVYAYSRRLAQVDRTIEINLNSARRNKILVYDENTRLSMENINTMLDSGAATVPVRREIADQVTALDLGVDPKSIESLSVVRSKLWSEAMGLLGINNANQEKKERLVESEVSANDDQINNMRRVNLNSRQAAAKQINEKFKDYLNGQEVSVDYYTDVDATLPASPLGQFPEDGEGEG